MKLTCVTAVFNAIKSGNRENLIRCVNSVASLKTSHEHLIYDGASNDGTTELLRELEQQVPGLTVVSEKDTGLYNALNKGVRDAKGEWFYVLGCDDYVAWPQEFDAVISSMPSATDIIAAKVNVDRGGSLSDDPYRRWRILISMPYGHQGMVAKTSCVREVGGFDERFRIAADYDMIVKFHLEGKKIRYVNKTIAVFSLGGMSTNGSDKSFTEGEVIAEKLHLHECSMPALLKSRVLPFRNTIRLLFHKDPTIRLGAVYMLVRKVFYPKLMGTKS